MNNRIKWVKPAVLLAAACVFQIMTACGKEEVLLLPAQPGQETAAQNEEPLAEEDAAGSSLMLEEDTTEPVDIMQEESAEEPVIYVYVCGAVARQGVYPLHESARVYEAIEAAGGLLEDAEVQNLNLAAPLSDSDMVRIPAQGETQKAVIYRGIGLSETAHSGISETAGNSAEEDESGIVHINSADAAQLMKLTGIGEVRAKAILDYRLEHGEFQSIEEIMNVPGIKTSTYEKIKDNIRL